MLKRIVRYVYHYGVGDFLRQLIDRSYTPRHVGLMLMLRSGVLRVGTFLTIPTLQSVMLQLRMRRARAVSVWITLLWQGGTAAYLKSQMRQKSEDELAFVVKPIGRLGLLYVDVWSGGCVVQHFYIKSLKALYSLHERCTELVVNHIIQWHSYYTPVAFGAGEYGRIIDDIIRLKNVLQTAMRFNVHDYFSVCPRFTLTNEKLSYCDSEVSCRHCQTCLETLENAYIDYEIGMKIDDWRAVFRRLFQNCEEVRVFSEDTRERLDKIYPGMNLRLVPHQNLSKQLRKPMLCKKGLTIGVFGDISGMKGCRQVVMLAQHIKRAGIPNTKIVIVGTMMSVVDDIPYSVKVTGPYKRDDLPDLIEQHHINMAFFPSICPETFSYVVQELMQMQVPTVCYNIGAPKDRIAKYEHGRIIPENTTEATWSTICELAFKEGISY